MRSIRKAQSLSCLLLSLRPLTARLAWERPLRPYDPCGALTVTITLLKGVARIYSCRARKILDDQIGFLTCSEPQKLYTRSIGNNKGVAPIILSARKYLDSSRFPYTCSMYYEPRFLVLPQPLGLVLRRPPLRKPKTQNKFLGGVVLYCHGNIIPLYQEATLKSFKPRG